MNTHAPWFKKIMNPILRKLFKIEITSIFYQEKLIGYGIRKQI